MAVRIQFRRGTAAEWTSANPTLAAGELGYETDTTKFKLGDGSTAWTSLGYGGVSQADIDNAVANVIDLAPGTLDTLNELAASIGDDADFANTVANNIANAVTVHNDDTTNVHGIEDTSVLETTSGAQSKANAAQANAQSYADTAIANLIDSAPGTLNTLNELANALGDDANFSTTITNNLANKISFESDASADYISANAVTSANTFYIVSDAESYVKIGDGVTNWNDLTYVGSAYADNAVQTHADETTNVHGISNTLELVYDSDLTSINAHVAGTQNVHGISDTQNLIYQTDLDTHNSDTANVHGIADTSLLETTSGAQSKADAAESAANSYTDNAITTHAAVTDNVHGISNTLALETTSGAQTKADGALASAETYADNAIATHNADTTNVHGISNVADLVVSADLADYAPIANATLTGTVSLPSTTTIGDISSAEIGYLENVSSNIQSQLDAKAPSTDATFAGTISLPSTTSIGDISATEISYLNNVSGAIQTQIDAKLASATASVTYAPLANATLTGTVSLPATTSIGDVSATEIGYLNNVSSAIQTQLDAKLASATASSTYAPIDSPTFTTAATLPASTTIGDVSATEISYLNNVTSAIQTQLDAKAPIANATFTGTTEAVDLTLTGNLYVQGSTTTISTSNLKLRDNMTYLNQAGLFDLSGAAGDGTNVVYTTSTTHDIEVGDYVTVANTTPSSFEISGEGSEVLAVTDNTITVASTVTDTYTSGGQLRGKIHANPDLGWAAGRYTANTYAHAGFFRDATDGVFKVFDGYVPEPDESAFIDTSHNTFALASFAAATVTAANVVATTGVTFADNTIQTSAGVPSLTGFTEKTASYTLDTLDHQDNVVEMNSGSALTFTIPTNSALAWPVGASMDIIQTGAGQVTISPDTGVTLNYTPGNKLRTQWSSCTIMKRASDSWIVYGDLTA